MTKKAIEGKEARNKLMVGIDLVADAVKCSKDRMVLHSSSMMV